MMLQFNIEDPGHSEDSTFTMEVRPVNGIARGRKMREKVFRCPVRLFLSFPQALSFSSVFGVRHSAS